MEHREIVAEGLRRGLTACGHGVSAVRTCDMGVFRILDSPPDIVLVGEHLPVIGALDMRAFLLRRFPSRAVIPFVLVQDARNPVTMAEAFVAGVDHCVAHPVAFSDLDRWIRALTVASTVAA